MKQNRESGISEAMKHLAFAVSTEIARNQKGSGQKWLIAGKRGQLLESAIWTDQDLDALDVRSWGVIRKEATLDLKQMHSLNLLLKDKLQYAKATISKTLYVLRLTRWVSFCPVNNDQAGQVYIVHETPCTLEEAIYLDPYYLTFVESQLEHNNKQIRELAQAIWNTRKSEVMLPSSGHSNNEPHRQEVTDLVEKSADFICCRGSAIEKEFPVQNLKLTEPAEISYVKQPVMQLDQELNQGSFICSSLYINNTTTTVPGLNHEPWQKGAALIYPDEFKPEEIKLAARYLAQVEPDLQQAFLDETAAKIKTRVKTTNPIRNPVGYLAWMCNAHGQGLPVLTSLCVRHAEDRIKSSKAKSIKEIAKSQKPNADKQVKDKEAYRSRINALKASLNTKPKTRSAGHQDVSPSAMFV